MPDVSIGVRAAGAATDIAVPAVAALPAADYWPVPDVAAVLTVEHDVIELASVVWPSSSSAS